MGPKEDFDLTDDQWLKEIEGGELCPGTSFPKWPLGWNPDYQVTVCPLEMISDPYLQYMPVVRSTAPSPEQVETRKPQPKQNPSSRSSRRIATQYQRRSPHSAHRAMGHFFERDHRIQKPSHNPSIVQWSPQQLQDTLDAELIIPNRRMAYLPGESLDPYHPRWRNIQRFGGKGRPQGTLHNRSKRAKMPTGGWTTETALARAERVKFAKSERATTQEDPLAKLLTKLRLDVELARLKGEDQAMDVAVWVALDVVNNGERPVDDAAKVLAELEAISACMASEIAAARTRDVTPGREGWDLCKPQ